MSMLPSVSARARTLEAVDSEPEEVLPLLEKWLQTGGAYTVKVLAETLMGNGAGGEGLADRAALINIIE